MNLFIYKHSYVITRNNAINYLMRIGTYDALRPYYVVQSIATKSILFVLKMRTVCPLVF